MQRNGSSGRVVTEEDESVASLPVLRVIAALTPRSESEEDNKGAGPDDSDSDPKGRGPTSAA